MCDIFLNYKNKFESKLDILCLKNSNCFCKI